MNPEKPNQPTPDEIAEIEKSRTISDAELLKGGAEYVVNEKGEKENMLMAQEQEFDHEFEAERNRRRLIHENIQRQGLKSRDKVKVKLVLPEGTYNHYGRFISAKETEDKELYLVGDPTHYDCLQVTTILPSEWPPAEGIARDQWKGRYFDIDFSNIKDVEKAEN